MLSLLAVAGSVVNAIAAYLLLTGSVLQDGIGAAEFIGVYTAAQIAGSLAAGVPGGIG